MFTKLASNITFSDIEDFCREFSEGVRVEYKRDIDIKKHIPKIASSFANTSGGIFLIGVETDSTNQVKFPIQGIAKRRGIEEQIQQSALTGIYPAVTPEVITHEVPNTNNIVVIVRVDESPQAPHAIQNSTRAYIRTGSITQPYELAEIDRIEYMLKRRGRSQEITQQILKRIEERIESFVEINSPDLDRNSPYLDTNLPNLTVIARPVFPYHPIISTGDISNFAKNDEFLTSYYSLVSRSRVSGGLFTRASAKLYGSSTYTELNEYGLVYQRSVLRKIPTNWQPDRGCYLMSEQFVWKIGELIRLTQSFYEQCEYAGHIEVIAQLRQIFGEALMLGQGQLLGLIKQQRSYDSEISASTQYLPRDLVKREKFIEVVDGLVDQLFWAFNIDTSVNCGSILITARLLN